MPKATKNNKESKKTESVKMKDKNGIEIDCQNCEAFEYCKDSSAYEQCQNKAFSPSKEAYEARIQELQNENSLLKDGKSHIMDVKMSPRFVKSIIRAINSEIRDLKEELRFTDEEINLIRNTLQELIWEDECDGSAEKKIIDKCYAILKAKERIKNANIHNKRQTRR